MQGQENMELGALGKLHGGSVAPELGLEEWGGCGKTGTMGKAFGWGNSKSGGREA